MAGGTRLGATGHSTERAQGNGTATARAMMLCGRYPDPLVGCCLWRLLWPDQPVLEPLPQPSESIYEEPRLTGTGEVVCRTGAAYELDRHTLLLQGGEPLLGVGHRGSVVLLGLDDQCRRLHAVGEADRGEGVVHRDIVPRLAVELELGQPLRI